MTAWRKMIDEEYRDKDVEMCYILLLLDKNKLSLRSAIYRSQHGRSCYSMLGWWYCIILVTIRPYLQYIIPHAPEPMV